MELVVLLPIAAFIALAAGLAVVLRGTGRIVARTREAEQFRAAVGELATRVDASIGSAAEQIDQVRRRQLDPGTIVATIGAATDAIGRYRDEAKAIRAPRKAQRIRSALVAELERAQRALEMVDHGTTIMIGVRRGPRELEAQTSIKRGYLNLIHARDAFGAHVLEAQAFEVQTRTSRVDRKTA